METGYFEGAPGPRSCREAAGHRHSDWGWAGDDVELFVQARGDCCRLFVSGAQGPAHSWPDRRHLVAQPNDLDRVADDVYRRYREHGSLAVDGLDGSFTLALLDSQAERVMLYRNLIGTGFTYYHAPRRRPAVRRQPDRAACELATAQPRPNGDGAAGVLPVPLRARPRDAVRRLSTACCPASRSAGTGAA